MNMPRIIVLGVAVVAASAAAFLVRGLMGGGTPKVEAKIAPPAIAMSEVLVADARCSRASRSTRPWCTGRNGRARAVDSSLHHP